MSSMKNVKQMQGEVEAEPFSRYILMGLLLCCTVSVGITSLKIDSIFSFFFFEIQRNMEFYF